MRASSGELLLKISRAKQLFLKFRGLFAVSSLPPQISACINRPRATCKHILRVGKMRGLLELLLRELPWEVLGIPVIRLDDFIER